jgi:hypothetical protein
MISGEVAAVSVIRPMAQAGVGAVVEGIEEPGAGGEEADLGYEEGEAGARAARKMLNPALPSPDEVMEHNKTHLPFRNWCRHCARGRGVEM